MAFVTGANAVKASADIGSRPECAHFPEEATSFSGSSRLLEGGRTSDHYGNVAEASRDKHTGEHGRIANNMV
jgi:hypothetical protein